MLSQPYQNNAIQQLQEMDYQEKKKTENTEMP